MKMIDMMKHRGNKNITGSCCVPYMRIKNIEEAGLYNVPDMRRELLMLCTREAEFLNVVPNFSNSDGNLPKFFWRGETFFGQRIYLLVEWPSNVMNRIILVSLPYNAILSSNPKRLIFWMKWADLTWSMITWESPKMCRPWIFRKSQKLRRPTKAIASALLFDPFPPFHEILIHWSTWGIM